MRVVINTLAGWGPPAGIGHYAHQLAEGLIKTVETGDSVEVFPHGWLDRCYRSCTQTSKLQGRRVALYTPKTFRLPSSLRSHFGAIPKWLSESARRTARWALGQLLRRRLRTVRADLYHEPNFIPLCWDVPTSITVHDLSPLLFPHWHPDYRVRWLEKYLERSLRQAKYILTVSEFTRHELIRHFGVAAERIHVTYPGIRDMFRPCPREAARSVLARIGLPADYLLYVGTLEPRKNLERVLRAYLRLPRSHRRSVPFVLVGKYGWGAERLAELIATTGPGEGVWVLGYVPDRWLSLLYNGARALVYPSCYEGFGLPPVEMLACGGRVVVSDLAVFRETLGPFALRVSVDDCDAWYRTLRQLVMENEAQDRPDWDALAWVQRFCWQNCARQTWQAFRSPFMAVRPAA